MFLFRAREVESFFAISLGDLGCTPPATTSPTSQGVSPSGPELLSCVCPEPCPAQVSSLGDLQFTSPAGSASFFLDGSRWVCVVLCFSSSEPNAPDECHEPGNHVTMLLSVKRISLAVPDRCRCLLHCLAVLRFCPMSLLTSSQSFNSRAF